MGAPRLLGVAAAAAAAAASPVPSGMGVPLKRFLMDTEWGQLHYAVSKPWDHAKRTLVLYHSNPHSMIEFTEFLNGPLIKGRYNFLLHDYFGMGGSDDCLPPACGAGLYDEHPCVTVEEFVSLTTKILDGLGVTQGVVCMGHLKGGSLAIECAHQLGPRCEAVFAIDADYFPPEALPKIIAYANHTKNVEFTSDGAHLLDAWFQPSCAPCDFVNGSYCGCWEPLTLKQNEWKTSDRIRAFQSQWQYVMMGLQYNDQLINETVIRAMPAKKQLSWGATGITMRDADGFDGTGVTKLMDGIWQKASGNTTVIDICKLGNEGSMVQNASYYARQLTDLLGQ